VNPINVNDSDTRVRGWVFKHPELMEIGTKLLWLTSWCLATLSSFDK
jgi:hypothetical protein